MREGETKRDVVLFDLDGTLLDSLEDMKDSVNHVMGELGFPVRTLDEIRSFVGNGIRKLIERSVPQGTDSETCERALAAYRSYYGQHCMEKTRPYPGIPELLETLKRQGVRMAIVSNKNEDAVRAVHARYFPDTIEIAVGQSDAVPKKPDPAMVYAALRQMGVSAERAVYVGDSEVDIETAKNAGIDCITCVWGFRTKEFLLENGARILAERAEEIPQLL